MPKKLQKKFYIINLDDETGPGTHWVLMYNIQNPPIYFDSFGVWPPRELYQIKNLLFNEYRVQKLDSNLCGLYVIYIVDELLKKREFMDIL